MRRRAKEPRKDHSVQGIKSQAGERQAMQPLPVVLLRRLRLRLLLHELPAATGLAQATCWHGKREETGKKNGCT
jgi:hypothetical protein